eukprot:scaffold521_cov167-Amphora_coffeaeformis.AAC.28
MTTRITLQGSIPSRLPSGKDSGKLWKQARPAHTSARSRWATDDGNPATGGHSSLGRHQRTVRGGPACARGHFSPRPVARFQSLRVRLQQQLDWLTRKRAREDSRDE